MNKQDYSEMNMSDDDRKMPFEVTKTGLVYRLSDDMNPRNRKNVYEISVNLVDGSRDIADRENLAKKIAEFLMSINE